jgi:TonB family protein
VGIDASGAEVFMQHPRTVKCNPRFVFLAVVAFLISGIVTALPDSSTQQGHLIPAESSHAQSIGFKVLSSTEGIDFKPYLTTTLISSIVRNFHPKIPKSAAIGEKEPAVVQVRIKRDGSLSDGFVTIVSSSGVKELDAAALSAVRTAAPFGRLPEGYPGTCLDLQIIFYYTNMPQEPEQKPKIVPIVTALSHTVLCAWQIRDSRQSSNHRFDGRIPLGRLVIPAQPVDATPSSALIRRCFRGSTACLAALGQNLGRAAFLLVLPWQAILAFVFNARGVLA